MAALAERPDVVSSRTYFALAGLVSCVLAQDYDVVSRTTKLRRAGFHEIYDTEEMVIDHLTRYREARLLP